MNVRRALNRARDDIRAELLASVGILKTPEMQFQKHMSSIGNVSLALIGLFSKKSALQLVHLGRFKLCIVCNVTRPSGFLNKPHMVKHLA